MKQLIPPEIMGKIAVLKNNAKAVMAAAGLVFLIDGFIIVGFQCMPLARMWKQASAIKTDIVGGRQDIRSMDTFKKRQENLKKELAVLDKKMIIENDLPKILEAVSKFADVSSVRILKIRPMGEVRGSQKPVIVSPDMELIREKISITAMGGFHQLGRFIALLENSPIFFDVKKLEIRGNAQEYMKHSVTIFLDVVMRKT